MKKLFFALAAATAGFAAFGPAAQAQYYEGREARDYRGYRDREVIVERDGPKRNRNDGYDRYYNRHRRKTVYLIERGRPVRREVFFDGRGRYYQIIDDRPVFIRERVFESYPERYYHRDGRPRAGITLNFGG